MTSPADIINGALELIGAQTTIAALDDGTPAGNAAGVIYQPTVRMLLRQLDPDFAQRGPEPLMLLIGGSPGYWTFEYAYPGDCLRLRQVSPAPGMFDPLDSKPILWDTGFDQVLGVGTRVVYSNLATALATYTTSLVTEDQWDDSFAEAMRRQLANPLAMALAGRPDFAIALLEQAARYEQMSEMSDESAALPR